jgi:Ufm1-specific protease 1
MTEKDLLELDEIENYLKLPNEISAEQVRLWTVKGSYKYYHYDCDKFNDIGWGCGYRTIQTICSWIRNRLLGFDSSSAVPQVPSILDIQKILVECGDKPISFIGSKQWIGN